MLLLRVMLDVTNCSEKKASSLGYLPVCLLNNQQFHCPLLTAGQNAVQGDVSKPLFQMVGLQPDAFKKQTNRTLYCKCCYVSVYPFLIKMLSKTAGFMYIPIFLLIMVS